ncbi:MAG: transposase [Methylococcales bacterium]
MKYNPNIHHRRSIRLQNYDYSQAGAYFVTICIQNRECLLGKIDNNVIVLNEYGLIVQDKWLDLVNHIDNIELGEYVIMPNHFHGIIIVGAGSKPAHEPEINNMIGADLELGAGEPRAGLEPAPTKKCYGLSEIVRQFKTFSAKRINIIRQTPAVPVWQRNYYEHIIRNDADYMRIAEYVDNNPRLWAEDSLNPVNTPPSP